MAEDHKEFYRAFTEKRPPASPAGEEEAVPKVIVNPSLAAEAVGLLARDRGAGALLFVAGQTAQDADGRIAPVGDLVGQFRRRWPTSARSSEPGEARSGTSSR